MYAEFQCPSRLHFSLEALPADVRRDWYFYRQCAEKEVKGVGAVDCSSMQEAISGQTDAGAAVAFVGIGRGCHRTDRVCGWFRAGGDWALCGASRGLMNNCPSRIDDCRSTPSRSPA